MTEAELTASGEPLGCAARVAREVPWGRRPPRQAVPGASLAEIEALYRSRSAAFLRFATAFLGDHELARDTVQEGFARALRRRESFRGEGSVEAWLWRTVVNTVRNTRRSRALRRVQPLDPETAGADEAPAGEAGLLREAVARLPERQRACVFLRYFADLDYAGIAAALDVTPGTVAATLNAAHRALRAHLERAPEEER
jgi:RNA polymerase sigma factor (sigma-70 family)